MAAGQCTVKSHLEVTSAEWARIIVRYPKNMQAIADRILRQIGINKPPTLVWYRTGLVNPEQIYQCAMLDLIIVDQRTHVNVMPERGPTYLDNRRPVPEDFNSNNRLI